MRISLNKNWAILFYSYFLFFAMTCSGQTSKVLKTLEVSSTPKNIDSTFQLLLTIPIKRTYLTADNLHNIYVANQKGQIQKYDKKGKKQFEYNNKRLGSVGKIDARNPFRILVYYPDFEVIILLDRTLTPIGELNLYDLAFIEPKAVAMANDNNIWIFDQVAAILKKINQNGKIIFESKNLNQLTQKNINPSFLQEQNNLLYLTDFENGLFIFDTFGQLKQHIPKKGINRFQVIDQQIIYFKKGELFSFDMEILKEKKINFPIKSSEVESVMVQRNLLFITRKEGVEVYGLVFD